MAPNNPSSPSVGGLDMTKTRPRQRAEQPGASPSGDSNNGPPPDAAPLAMSRLDDRIAAKISRASSSSSTDSPIFVATSAAHHSETDDSSQIPRKPTSFPGAFAEESISMNAMLKAKSSPYAQIKSDETTAQSNNNRQARAVAENSKSAAQSKLQAKANGQAQLQTAEDIVQAKINRHNTIVTRDSNEKSQDTIRSKEFTEVGQTTPRFLSKVNSDDGLNAPESRSTVSRGTLSDFEEQVLAKVNTSQHLNGTETAESNGITVTIGKLPQDLQDLQDHILEKVQNNADDSALYSEATTTPRDDLADPHLIHGVHDIMDKTGLAVAFAVPNEENTFLPSAVEFDPDSKPPVFRHGRFCVYASLVMVAVMAGTVGSVVGLLLVSRATVVPPPLSDRATLGIRDYVEQLVGDSVPLDDLDSPYRQALDWIQDVDPMALTPDSKKFAQRYLAAYFYYATTMYQDWSNKCVPSDEEKPNNNCNFKILLAGDDGEIRTAPSAMHWLSSEDECLWGGVTCDTTGQIFRVEFGGSNMTGSFPEGLWHLPYLHSLTLAHGHLEGPLPSFIGKYLWNLELAGNRFTGTIPDALYESNSLIQVNVGNNNLTGTISPSVGRWKRTISFVSFYNNFLSGSIPVELGNFSRMLTLSLRENLLTGSVPTSLIPSCRRLEVLRLQHNRLTGPLPSGFGELTDMKYLSLQHNLFNGTLPSGMANLTLLWELDVSNNQFSGSIEPLVNLTRMEKLRIENNRFSGEMPKEVGQLKEMILFSASGNNFSGTVPQSVCNRVPNEYRPGSGSNQVLRDFQMDCAIPSDGVTEPELDCPCCTACCNADGLNCEPVV